MALPRPAVACAKRLDSRNKRYSSLQGTELLTNLPCCLSSRCSGREAGCPLQTVWPWERPHQLLGKLHVGLIYASLCAATSPAQPRRPCTKPSKGNCCSGKPRSLGERSRALLLWDVCLASLCWEFGAGVWTSQGQANFFKGQSMKLLCCPMAQPWICSCQRTSPLLCSNTMSPGFQVRG